MSRHTESAADRQRVNELEPERTRAMHIADKLRAELEWRGRVQGQEERRLRSHAQHAEEGRRRVEAQLAYVSMELQRGQVDIADGKLTAETILKKIEVLVNEEASRVKMHRNADAYLSSDMAAPHPMFAHHAVAPPLFAPAVPRQHGWVGGGGGGAGSFEPSAPPARGAGNALPWAAFDVELGKELRLPAIVPGAGAGQERFPPAGSAPSAGGEAGTGSESPKKKRQVRQSNIGGPRAVGR